MTLAGLGLGLFSAWWNPSSSGVAGTVHVDDFEEGRDRNALVAGSVGGDYEDLVVTHRLGNAQGRFWLKVTAPQASLATAPAVK